MKQNGVGSSMARKGNPIWNKMFINSSSDKSGFLGIQKRNYSDRAPMVSPKKRKTSALRIRCAFFIAVLFIFGCICWWASAGDFFFTVSTRVGRAYLMKIVSSSVIPEVWGSLVAGVIAYGLHDFMISNMDGGPGPNLDLNLPPATEPELDLHLGPPGGDDVVLELARERTRNRLLLAASGILPDEGYVRSLVDTKSLVIDEMARRHPNSFWVEQRNELLCRGVLTRQGTEYTLRSLRDQLGALRQGEPAPVAKELLRMKANFEIEGRFY